MMVLKSILVATDFGEASETALRYGRELARRFGADLHLLYVADDLASRVSMASGVPADIGHMQSDLEARARRDLDALLSDEDRRLLRARAVVLTSAATAHTIVAYAADEHIDLIIMGTHGRGAVAHFFVGSVAEKVVRRAPCPVLTVRHPEHEFVQPDALERIAHV
jgi:nucleotide-binding universal stress UspA family protein